MIDVAEINPHRSFLLPITAQRRPGEQSHFLKRTVVFIAIEIIRAGIVGDIQIRPAIIVVIRPHSLHPEIVRRIVDSGFLGDILKRSVSSIAKQEIGFSRQSPGATLDRYAAELACLFVTAELRQFVDVYIHVTGNKEIYITIAVEVTPCRSRAEAANLQAGFLGHVFELAVPEVAVKNIPAVSSDVNVLPAVVIEVCDSDAHAPTLAGKSCLFRDLAKFQITFLMVKRDHEVATLLVMVHRRAIYGDDIELAIVVAVDETHASAHRLQDVTLFRRRIVRYREARFLTYILEAGNGQRRS